MTIPGLIVLMRAPRFPQRKASAIGQAPVQDLSLVHEALDRNGDVFDRHLGINSVLVKQFNAVGLESLQHPFDRATVPQGRRPEWVS
jgi:hypothetical protein